MRPYVYAARPIPREAADVIREHCELKVWESDEPIPQDMLYEEIAEADGLVTSGTPINASLLDRAPRLRIVSNVAVGYNNFDVQAMRARRVWGTHTPGVLDDTVADLVMAMMLAAARRIPELDALTKQGNWHKGNDRPFFGLDVHHRTLGIIGMGRIGEKIAKRAAFGFDMPVLYSNRSRRREAEQQLGVQYREREDLLRESDFIVLMTPLTPETRGLIGEQEFRLMKREAIFINASRGQTVDEDALIAALQQGEIRSAALDVFELEPVSPDNPLLAMPSVVTLPHIGSATAQTRFDMAMRAAENVVKGVTGERPPHVVRELTDLI